MAGVLIVRTVTAVFSVYCCCLAAGVWAHSLIPLLSTPSHDVMVKAPPTAACHGATVYDPGVFEPVTHSRNIWCFNASLWHRCHLLSDIYVRSLPLNEELSLSSRFTWALRGRKREMEEGMRSEEGWEGLPNMLESRDGGWMDPDMNML